MGMKFQRLFTRLGALLGLCLVACLLGAQASAEQIRIAVATNFSAPMREIIKEFEQASEHRVRLSLGSSGKLYAQIKNGAPFDVFFSADQSKPEVLQKENWIVPDSRFTYAVGSLALWSNKPGQDEQLRKRLAKGQYRKLALANPKLAPYGVAAREVLAKLGLLASSQAKFVQGENIAQAYQFVATGNADMGFVALSQIAYQGQLKSGSAWIIPEQLHSPINQDAVLLKTAANNAAAKAFLDFMRSTKALAIMQSYGYQTEQMCMPPAWHC